MSLAFTLTPTSINILLDGRMRTISKTHMNFDAVVDIVRQIGKTTDPFVQCDKMDALRELIDIKSFIARVTEGRVQIGDTSVQFDGAPVHSVVATRLVKMLGEGFDVRPMARFLDKLMQNPLESARNELYEWLEKSELPIAADGDFLAFKKVNNDYKSYYDSTTDNSIGSKPSVSRDSCDTNRSNTCSSGLHFCSFAYLPHYMGNQGRVVICKINPADVTAIPNDYDTAKGRAWTYEIIGEVPEDEAKAAFPDSVVEDFGTYHDAGEDSDDGSADYDDSASLDWHDEEYEEEEEDDSPLIDRDDMCDDDEEPVAAEAPVSVGPVTMYCDARRVHVPSALHKEIAEWAKADVDVWQVRCIRELLSRPEASGPVEYAFTWAGTPQGHDFWAFEYKRGALTNAARAILQSWVTEVDSIRAASIRADKDAAVERAAAAAAAAEADSREADADLMPREVKHDPIRLALQGSHVGLINAFSWQDTPQGFDYWCGIYSHLQIGGDLPHEAELILASWARRVGAIQDDLIVEPVAPVSGPVPSTLDLVQFKQTLDGRASGLFTAFSWRETNQGFDFWADQYNGNHISDEGKAILEAWAKELGIITKPPVTFMHGGKVYYPAQLRDMLKEHGQRGTSRLTGVPRSTLQDWAKRI